MNAKLNASTGDGSPAPMRFFSYKDPEENTREQIKKVRSHPWIAKDVLCGASFSTWTPVSCGKCGQGHSRLLPERTWAYEV